MDRPDLADRRLGRLEARLDLVIKIVPYVSLAVSTALAVLVQPLWPGLPPLPGQLVLAAVAGVWMLWWVTLHPSWQHRRGLMAGYYVGLIVLIGALVLQSPLFGFFAFTGYLHVVYALCGWWRVPGVAVIAVITSVSQVGGFATLGTPIGLTIFGVVMAFNIGLATALMSLGWVTTEQSERRKQVIAALAETNDRLETALAENAGLHAQLLAQAREAGVLDERQRLAGEIHDTLAQGLTGIVTQLEAAEQVAAQPDAAQPDTWQRHVRSAARLARESLTEARRSVHAMRPEPLEHARLPEALAAVVERWSADSGVAAGLTVTGVPQPLLPDIEVALLRTAQEALANVAKHAAAGRVGLTLSYMEDLVTLDVRDDGTGFEPAQVDHTVEGGFGLTAMRDRLNRIAGTLVIESERDTGTAVSACVPAILAGGAG